MFGAHMPSRDGRWHVSQSLGSGRSAARRPENTAVTFLTQCDTGTDIFACIRRNPLKSLDSAKQMQAIFLGFIWITLHLFGRRTPFGG
jgi:hypothetical protein